jgi:hypothetical protein
MSDQRIPEPTLASLLTTAESLVRVAGASFNEPDMHRVIGLVREAEQMSPGGAALHAQLDTVAKWLALLASTTEHERFGGTARVREHVFLQFRLAQAAAEDYLKATEA